MGLWDELFGPEPERIPQAVEQFEVATRRLPIDYEFMPPEQHGEDASRGTGRSGSARLTDGQRGVSEGRRKLRKTRVLELAPIDIRGSVPQEQGERSDIEQSRSSEVDRLRNEYLDTRGLPTANRMTNRIVPTRELLRLRQAARRNNVRWHEVINAPPPKQRTDVPAVIEEGIEAVDRYRDTAVDAFEAVGADLQHVEGWGNLYGALLGLVRTLDRIAPHLEELTDLPNAIRELVEIILTGEPEERMAVLTALLEGGADIIFDIGRDLVAAYKAQEENRQIEYSAKVIEATGRVLELMTLVGGAVRVGRQMNRQLRGVRARVMRARGRARRRRRRRAESDTERSNEGGIQGQGRGRETGSSAAPEEPAGVQEQRPSANSNQQHPDVSGLPLTSWEAMVSRLRLAQAAGGFASSSLEELRGLSRLMVDELVSRAAAASVNDRRFIERVLGRRTRNYDARVGTQAHRVLKVEAQRLEALLHQEGIPIDFHVEHYISPHGGGRSGSSRLDLVIDFDVPDTGLHHYDWKPTWDSAVESRAVRQMDLADEAGASRRRGPLRRPNVGGGFGEAFASQESRHWRREFVRAFERRKAAGTLNRDQLNALERLENGREVSSLASREIDDVVNQLDSAIGP